MLLYSGEKIMKQLMLKSDVDDKVITTTRTKPEDVFGYDAIVLGINKNDKTEGFLVKEKVKLDGRCKIQIGYELITPYYWIDSTSQFEYLWELQKFYDLFIFEDMISLQKYMCDNNIKWAR